MMESRGRFLLLLPLFLLPLSLALAGAARADYRGQAEAQTDFIQAHFFDAAQNKYHDTFPWSPKALPWAFMWANGVQWRVLTVATQADPAKYGPSLAAFGRGLNDYWDPQPKGSPPGFNAYCSGPGGDDKYYDDNAWMVLGFLEAYGATRDAQYLRWAQATQAFVLSGWDDKLGGGIYWSLKRQSKNTCVNAPAAVAALRLSALGGGQDQEGWALKIISWLDANLQDKDGLYWDAENLDGTVGKTEWTYNTGLMIQADVLQFRPGDARALPEAERSADAAIAKWQDPQTGAFANNANFTHLLCEGLLRLYEADHRVAYLNAVRRHAVFGDRYVRDPRGGYWNNWTAGTHKPDERKSLLENASDARLLWLLAPYPDSDALYARGIAAASKGHDAIAEDLFRQAADSDTQAVEARYRLWRVLLRERRASDAAAEARALVRLANDPPLRARLEAVEWKAPGAASDKP